MLDRELLGVRRFFSVGPTETLEALLAESATNQQEVTDQLGRQVRQAVSVYVVDQLYGSVDVPAALEQRLPPDLKTSPAAPGTWEWASRSGS